MFERYTEKARRTIFTGRMEAGRGRSTYIETQHLLTGVLSESPQVIAPFLSRDLTAKVLLSELTAMTEAPAKGFTSSVDIPLSLECKRALAYASEDAERLGHRHIGTEHILLGLLREEHAASRFLGKYGVQRETVWEHVSQGSPDTAVAARLAELERRAEEHRRRTPDRPSTGSSFSFDHSEDGATVVETHRFHQGHEITLLERLRLSDDGKTLLFSLDVTGPKQGQHVEFSFDVS